MMLMMMVLRFCRLNVLHSRLVEGEDTVYFMIKTKQKKTDTCSMVPQKQNIG